MNWRHSFLAIALALASPADTLHLRSGETVDGTYVGGSADDIRFLVDDQVQHFARSNVADIVFSGPSGAPSSASPGSPSGSPPNPRSSTGGEYGPDYPNAPFLRGANGYIPLEKQYSTPTRGGGMYGMGGTVYRVQGASSPVRVRQGDRIVFVVRFDNGGDPRQFQLYRLESRMGYRQTQPSMGGGPPALLVNINRVSDSVYEIIPARGLAPGEYAVSPRNSSDSYCFGVDY